MCRETTHLSADPVFFGKSPTVRFQREAVSRAESIPQKPVSPQKINAGTLCLSISTTLKGEEAGSTCYQGDRSESMSEVADIDDNAEVYEECITHLCYPI